MAEKSERRAELKEKLISVAAEQIRADGLGKLRARNVTAEAGCALGALYNVFADVDDLIVHVNSRTLARLHEAVSKANEEIVEPRTKLVGLAVSYLEFARTEPALWMSLFEHRMPAGAAVPEWHLAEHAMLIQQIAEPLAALQPQLSKQQLAVRAKTLFSAVHGVVSMGLGDWFAGPGALAVEGELRLIVNAMVSGLQVVLVDAAQTAAGTHG